MTLEKLLTESKKLGLGEVLQELSVIYGYKPTYLTDAKRKKRKLPQPLLNQVKLRLKIKELEEKLNEQG